MRSALSAPRRASAALSAASAALWRAAASSSGFSSSIRRFRESLASLSLRKACSSAAKDLPDASCAFNPADIAAPTPLNAVAKTIPACATAPIIAGKTIKVLDA